MKKIKKMMKEQRSLAGCLLACYLFPLFLLTLYSMKISSNGSEWRLFAFGLFLSSIGTVILFLFLSDLEKQITSTNLVKRKSSSKKGNLCVEEQPLQQIAEKEETIAWQESYEKLTEAFKEYKIISEEELRKKDAIMKEYEETINQQRKLIAKNQQQIAEFETKVDDLKYEISVLLQLAEIETNRSSKEEKKSPSPFAQQPANQNEEEINSGKFLIKTTDEASFQLKRCIDIAQKITATHYFRTHPRFRNIPIDSYALDLRRLFDNLQSENNGVVFVYSQKENRVLFVTPQIKKLLGWSQEKFLQNFHEIIQKNSQDWIHGIGQLTSTPELKLSLSMKNYSGKEKKVFCQMGNIPTGLFRHHGIAVLY